MFVCGHNTDTGLRTWRSKLADREVRSLAAPAIGNRIEYDTEVKGFGVRITSTGAKVIRPELPRGRA